jgi:hypothetical protein
VNGNPFDPGERSATIVKPGELIDVIEITPLTLNDRRTYNLLIAHACKDILEDKLHRIPKVEFKGTHNNYDRLSDLIRALMGAQVEVPGATHEMGQQDLTRIIHEGGGCGASP